LSRKSSSSGLTFSGSGGWWSCTQTRHSSAPHPTRHQHTYCHCQQETSESALQHVQVPHLQRPLRRTVAACQRRLNINKCQLLEGPT
jgi:hypothetical protein